MYYRGVLLGGVLALTYACGGADDSGLRGGNGGGDAGGGGTDADAGTGGAAGAGSGAAPASGGSGGALGSGTGGAAVVDAGMVCEPGERFCSGSELRVCLEDGSGSEVEEVCGDAETCDPEQLDCVETCPAGAGERAVRLVEVHVGTKDYVVLENRSELCSAQLASLTLTVEDVDTARTSLAISEHLLQPGERALVSESESPEQAQATTSGLIDVLPDAGYVVLCHGECDFGDEASVLDLIAYDDGSTSPLPLPEPLTFSELSGVTTADMEDRSYVRVQFEGEYPDYRGEDWEAGPATRSSCPATEPSGTCLSTLGAVCHYGTTDCRCVSGGALLQFWICQ